jgi:membrane-associated phospholipid phosphatase
MKLRLLACACLLALGWVPAAGAGDGERPLSLPEHEARVRVARLDKRFLVGGAGLLLITGAGLAPHRQDVPREGLDARSITLGWDREAIRPRDLSSEDVGDALMAGCIAVPSFSTLLTARASERGANALRTLVEQAEVTLLADGACFLLKKGVSRPRPFTYLDVDERSSKGPNWATSDQTFESFPSGHATIAWAATAQAVSSLAVRRPDLPPSIHFLHGAAAGWLATALCRQRVEGGFHFPTDVLAGAALGTAIGGAIPLMRARGPEARGSQRPLGWGWLGVAGGCAAGLMLPSLAD